MTSPAPFRLEGVRACVFDAYGTLFDFASAAARCDDVPADKREALTALWRDKQLQYTWLRSLQNRYADFGQVTGEALDFALESLGLETPGLRDRLMDLYLGLEPFPEVPEVLRALRARGFKTAILSNGTMAMLGTLVEHPVLRDCSSRLSSTPSGSSRPIPRSTNTRSTGSPCRRRRSRSSHPTLGTPSRRRISACASSGATATASGASACPARRTAKCGRWRSYRGCWRIRPDAPFYLNRRATAAIGGGCERPFTTSPYMAAPRPRSSRPSAPA